jgi:hypothetical protein
MNQTAIVETRSRIVNYLAKRAAIAQIANAQADDEHGFEISSPADLLDMFISYPMEIDEPGCEERFAENKAYVVGLSANYKKVLLLLIERTAERYRREMEMSR